MIHMYNVILTVVSTYPTTEVGGPHKPVDLPYYKGDNLARAISAATVAATSYDEGPYAPKILSVRIDFVEPDRAETCHNEACLSLAVGVPGAGECLCTDAEHDGPTGPRNLAHFTEEDAETLIGRPLTETEYRAVVKALPFSTMGEAFTEVVHSICGYGDDEDGSPTDDLPAAEHDGDLPESHKIVLTKCEAETWRNIENGDANTEADVAADIVQHLTVEYDLPADDGWEPLATIDYSTDPAVQGTEYRLRHHTLNRQALVGETCKHYFTLAGVLEQVFPVE